MKTRKGVDEHNNQLLRSYAGQYEVVVVILRRARNQAPGAGDVCGLCSLFACAWLVSHDLPRRITQGFSRVTF